MESLGNSEELVARANQLWAMLDDLAETNPERYRHFMEQQLKEARESLEPPEPRLSLKTRVLAPTEKTLVINICQWNKVPAPRSLAEPIPLSAGEMQDMSDKSELYSILDIAYNPSVLERSNEDPAAKDHLIRLTLKYVEEHYHVTLDHAYSIEKCKVKGSIGRMRQRQIKEQPPGALSQENTQKEVTLSRLRNIVAEEESGDFALLTDPKPDKRCLIEEISCISSPGQFSTPMYEMATRKDPDGKPLKIELKVKLPDLRCVSQSHLSVSKDDILLECLDKYRLQLDLPEPVNEEATEATFYKKRGVLVITIPVREQE